eukprot:233726-Amphidinium_carterae.1
MASLFSERARELADEQPDEAMDLKARASELNTQRIDLAKRGADAIVEDRRLRADLDAGRSTREAKRKLHSRLRAEQHRWSQHPAQIEDRLKREQQWHEKHGDKKPRWVRKDVGEFD